MSIIQETQDREFAKNAVKAVTLALTELRRPVSVDAVISTLEDIEPLATDYYCHWFDKQPWLKGWERDLEQRAEQINRDDIPSVYRGFSSRLIQFIWMANESGIEDSGHDDPAIFGVRSLLWCGPEKRQAVLEVVRSFSLMPYGELIVFINDTAENGCRESN
jgi:hypothetical protein